MKTLRKIIDLEGEDVKPIKIRAVKAGMDLKNYIQHLITKDAQKEK